MYLPATTLLFPTLFIQTVPSLHHLVVVVIPPLGLLICRMKDPFQIMARQVIDEVG